MYSNEDLERFYFRYQTEALPHGTSLQTFCLNNNVPYNIFSKWYKDTRRKVIEVQVQGRTNQKDFGKSWPLFVSDGALPIDNNIAERTVRCMTTARNNSLHFGSDVGAEMAATYHSIISTVKLHGKSVWNYLGEFFKKLCKANADKTTFDLLSRSQLYSKVVQGERRQNEFWFAESQPTLFKKSLRVVRIIQL